MDQGYKHFSHPHNLIIHHLPEGIEVPCSGCNSSSTGTVYVCWQCNFFLHEQCCRAARSMKHPSHPSHPLTLVPYPTYLSNSFYCNSCKIIGTGFNYSCADCEFDLHVQCAYSISLSTSFQKTRQFQELVPSSWNAQHNNMAHNFPFTSVPHDSLPIPFMPPSSVSNEVYPTTSHDLAYVSVPPSRQNSITTSQDPYMTHLESSSVPVGSQNLIPIVQDPSMAQNRPFSNTMSSQNQIERVQYPSIDETGPSVSSPNIPPDSISSTHKYPSIPQNGPSVSIPMSSQDLISSFQYPSIAQTEPSVSIPSNPPNPIPSAHDPPPMAQNGPSDSIPTSYPTPVASGQNPSMAQSGPYHVSIPTIQPKPITSSQEPSMSGNGLKDKEITHFSHPHNLSIVNLQEDEVGDKDEDEENGVTCSGCENTLVGKGYSCAEPNCDFHLHEACFNLKSEIQHKAHPEHPLTLLPVAPYNNKNGEFTCNACFSDGTGFTYNCSLCTFDLHIQCVSLPETVKRSDHEHVLKLFYTCPVKGEDTISCDVCQGEVQKDRWVYYCESCDYGTHLGCVDCEECERDSIIDAQAQLQRLQIQMQMARQQAEFMAGLGASLANLA